MGKFARLAQKIGKQCLPGTVVFRQGDKADSMYLIYSGAFEVWREAEGKRESLGKLGPGDVFGEMAIVDQKPRAATVTSLEDSILIPVTAAFLKKNIQKDTHFIFQIIETLILRIDSTAEDLKQRFAEGAITEEDLAGENTVDSGPDMINFLKIFRGYANPEKYFKFDEDDEIFREGDLGDLMFIILEGTLEISFQTGGKRHLFARMDRGDFFGESALITDLPRSATAIAGSDLVVLPVVRKDLVEGIMSDPEAALQLVKILVLRLRKNLELLSAN